MQSCRNVFAAIECIAVKLSTDGLGRSNVHQPWEYTSRKAAEKYVTMRLEELGKMMDEEPDYKYDADEHLQEGFVITSSGGAFTQFSIYERRMGE